MPKPNFWNDNEKMSGTDGWRSVRPQCLDCARLNRQDPKTCEAFPRGIPIEILTNQHDHHRPFKGDGGLVFKPVVRAYRQKSPR